MKEKFVGIFASDELPHIIKRKKDSAYIANTDKSNEIGKHWVLAYRKENEVLFIDPLGESPRFYGVAFEKWLKHFPVKHLTEPVQGEDSNLCGLFVLYFFYFLSRGHSLKGILKMFSNKLHLNDITVLKFAWNNLRFNARRQLGLGRKILLYKKGPMTKDYEKMKRKCHIHGR